MNARMFDGVRSLIIGLAGIAGGVVVFLVSDDPARLEVAKWLIAGGAAGFGMGKIGEGLGKK